jgi:hypothetical protein
LLSVAVQNVVTSGGPTLTSLLTLTTSLLTLTTSTRNQIGSLFHDADRSESHSLAGSSTSRDDRTSEDDSPTRASGSRERLPLASLMLSASDVLPATVLTIDSGGDGSVGALDGLTGETPTTPLAVVPLCDDLRVDRGTSLLPFE